MFSSLAGLVSALFDLAGKLLLLVVYSLLTTLEPSCHGRDVLTERERETDLQRQYGTHELVKWWV